MKRISFGLLFLLLVHRATHAQGFDAQQLLLDWEKLTQLKVLLNDMYDGYRIVEKGYMTIRDISHGSFDLHKLYLDGLLAVSPEVKKYFKVAEIVRLQQTVLREYRETYDRVRSDGHFTAQEVSILGETFGRLVDGSTQTLAGLTSVLTYGLLRASDAERLRSIDRLYEEMRQKLEGVRKVGNDLALISVARASDEHDRDAVRRLYGLH